MNEQATAVAAPASAKPTRQAETVEMTDGRKVEFVGKQVMLKTGLVQVGDSLKDIDELTPEELVSVEPSHLHVRFDFRNGTTRLYPLNPTLAARFAVHGALQKYGDNLAGGVKKGDGTQSDDLDDWATETDLLHDQLKTGDWSKQRQGGGGGSSILIQALMEFTGRTSEEVRNHIKDWGTAEKTALRQDEDIKPIIERIEAEKASKGKKVDTGALKAGLKGLAA